MNLTKLLLSYLSVDDINHHYLFHHFQNIHSKEYKLHEYNHKFNTFIKNINFIFKNKDETYDLEINQFTDMTQDEFKNYYNMGEKNKLFNQKELLISNCKDYNYREKIVPDMIDWRDIAVTPVKNQGKCGSCWSFSSTGALEGAWALDGNKLVSLSEQELIDCSKRYGDFGCNGGLMDNAFEYVIDNGLTSEENYQYQATSGKCLSNKYGKIIEIRYCFDVPSNNQLALKEVVSNQPVSVAIQADTKIFQFYSGGVITGDECGTNLDHGVLVVGYGVEDDIPYWLVKNSWGEDWGDKGYVKIGRSDNTTDPGVCGIAMQPSFPVV